MNQSVGSDLGPLPMEHPRERLVRTAERVLHDQLIGWMTQPDPLTYAEMLRVVAGMMDRLSRIVLSAERRPDGPT